MTAENFIYWLQGFIECSNPEAITKEQIAIIKEHISLVLKKVTSSDFSIVYHHKAVPISPPVDYGAKFDLNEEPQFRFETITTC